MVNTVFSDNEIPKERNHYTCIAGINIDSVMRIEQCKYKEKKKKLVDFINVELDLNSDDSDGSNSE